MKQYNNSYTCKNPEFLHMKLPKSLHFPSNRSVVKALGQYIWFWCKLPHTYLVLSMNLQQQYRPRKGCNGSSPIEGTELVLGHKTSPTFASCTNPRAIYFTHLFYLHYSLYVHLYMFLIGINLSHDIAGRLLEEM